MRIISHVDPSAAQRGLQWKDLRRNLRYYLLVLPPIALLSRLPLGAARLLGRVAGALAWLLARTSRRRAMENLEHAFGREKSRRELRRICRGVFRNTALNVFELLVIHRWPPEKVRRVFAYPGGELGRIDAAFPRGTVGVTAHFGSWELLGLLFGAFLPSREVVVARRVYFEKFQELVERFRRQAGLEVIYTDESPRRLIGALRQGKILGMLPDQDLKVVNGVFVDFFGRPAYTSTSPVHLALATGSDVFTCYLVREGSRFRALWRPIPLQRTGQRDADLLENTRRWTQVLEEEIRAYPEQWVWFHRRWRTRPEDGPRRARRRRSARVPKASRAAQVPDAPLVERARASGAAEGEGQ